MTRVEAIRARHLNTDDERYLLGLVDDLAGATKNLLLAIDDEDTPNGTVVSVLIRAEQPDAAAALLRLIYAARAALARLEG